MSLNEDEVLDLSTLSKKELKAIQLQHEVNQTILATEKAELELASAAVLVESQQRKRRFRVRGHEDGYFSLVGHVNDVNVDPLVALLHAFIGAHEDAKKKDKPGITLSISSPGGYVDDGWRLFDELRATSLLGHKVTTVIRGEAASMAGILAQAGDVRVIGPESQLMIHEPAGGVIGKAHSIKDAAGQMDRLINQMVKVYMRRCDGKIKEQKLRDLFDRRDLWLSADEALKFGFVDRIG